MPPTSLRDGASKRLQFFLCRDVSPVFFSHMLGAFLFCFFDLTLVFTFVVSYLVCMCMCAWVCARACPVDVPRLAVRASRHEGLARVKQGKTFLQRLILFFNSRFDVAKTRNLVVGRVAPAARD